MIDFVQYWTGKSGIAVTRFILWLGIAPSKYYNWQDRYGKVNEHNALIPRDFWLEDWKTGRNKLLSIFMNNILWMDTVV